MVARRRRAGGAPSPDTRVNGQICKRLRGFERLEERTLLSVAGATDDHHLVFEEAAGHPSVVTREADGGAVAPAQSTLDTTDQTLQWSQITKLLAADGAEYDWFGGSSVAISGSTALVGADGDDDGGGNSGSAYIYRDSGSGWTQVTKLLPDDGQEDDTFGSSLSISGSTAIIGARGDDDNGPLSGSAYIFEDTGSGWTQVAKLLPDDGEGWDAFGWSVSISGSAAIVGTRYDDDNGFGAGSAYIFEDTGSGWTQVAKLLPDDGEEHDNFGESVSISGSTALVGAHYDDDNGSNSGSAYVFENTGSGWTQVAKLLPDDGAEYDYFGESVSMNGGTAIVGAWGDDDYGSKSGSAYIFEDAGSGWTQVAKLLPDDGAENDYFGLSVSISGSTAVVGAYGADDSGSASGSVYVYQDTGSTWTQVDKLQAGDGAVGDYFGYQRSVSISGNVVIVGAPGDDDNGSESGSAYVFSDITAPTVIGCAVAQDTGFSSTDLLTRDTTPELTFEFSEAVSGSASDVVVLDPNSNSLAPDSIAGWGTDTLTITFATPLTVDGRYTVTLKGTGTITDLVGNPLNGGSDDVRYFTLDTTDPSAAAGASDITSGGDFLHTVTVTYTDETAIAHLTTGTGDIRVTGPNGYDRPGTLLDYNPKVNTSPIVVDYQIPPPGGSWDAADNGMYTVWMQADEVEDTAGNPVLAGSIGSFTVTVDNIDVYGTAGDDEFTYVRDESANEHVVAVNGVKYRYDASIVRIVKFNGLVGDDSLRITGTGGNDEAYLDPGSLHVLLAAPHNNEVEAVSVEVVRVYGGGGSDEAYFAGSVENDWFYSYETYSCMTDSGASFLNYVRDFAYVEADLSTTGSPNSLDRAWLFDSDSPRDDIFRASPSTVRMDRGSTGTDDAVAIGFDVVRAYANGGGTNDRAYLTGSGDDDAFYSYETYSYLVDKAGAAFYILVLDFDYVQARGQGQAAADRAYLRDSPGNDTYRAYPTIARMDHGTTGTNDVEAIDFEVVKAYARNGGNDAAYLRGSAGDDRLYGYQEYAYLSGTGFYSYVELFDYVLVVGEAETGGDRADLYDSKRAADDTFVGQATYGQLTYAGGNSIRAEGFKYGYARADPQSDNDTCTLRSGTVWQAIGDWEVVNNLPPGAPASSDFDLDFARWIAALEDAGATSDRERESDQTELTGLDHVFKLFGSE